MSKTPSGGNEQGNQSGKLDVVSSSGEPTLAKSLTSVAVDSLPVVGSLKSLAQVFTGRDIFTGEKVSRGGELLGVFAGLIPGGKIILNSKRLIRLGSRVTKSVNPSSIKFSQPTVSQNFSSNGTINNTIAGLKNGSIKPGNIPAIRVVERNGELITLDNRRLLAFQAAGVNVPIQRVSLSNPSIAAEFAKKFNPVNGGQNIVVTPNAAGRSAAEAVLREHGKIR